MSCSMLCWNQMHHPSVLGGRNKFKVSNGQNINACQVSEDATRGRACGIGLGKAKTFAVERHCSSHALLDDDINSKLYQQWRRYELPSCAQAAQKYYDSQPSQRHHVPSPRQQL